MTGLVLAAARAERHGRDAGTTALRVGLVGVAVAQLALAVSPLLFAHDEGAPVHIAHEVGAWDVALAVGFLFAAWRPLRAVGLLPFVAALTVGLLGTAVVDVLHGRAVAIVETTHLLELVGALLLWLLTLTPRRRHVRRSLALV
jgi:predicted anti-sigma-YlaC factor YlaD